MQKTDRQPILLKDYKVPDYLVEEIHLKFELFEEKTLVTSRMTLFRNPKAAAPATRLRLNGEHFELNEIQVGGKTLEPSRYVVDENSLTLLETAERFELQIKNTLMPEQNLAFEGLYKSGGIFCTQCEAEGFRRITYFLDRPDVMTQYHVEIEADAQKYPVLLSNGNLVGSGSLPGGRHFAKWHDPFKKPCYLFALVAGDLGVIEDKFVTRSKRTISLQIFSSRGLEDRCLHAMDSLKKAMAWDENVFGLEYDLDRFMIVAVDDFNAGAMENKGLNIFNAKYILANPQTATDVDYEMIFGVVGHEYFHNWTGNRITCRDWFQLSLKEGLTVFRDQEFSCDSFSRPVKRIDDVIRLRNVQFAEDAGPMAHPVRPQSYIEINNFYTPTVYEKGAELIRMIHTIIGAENFRKGMDKYFELYDGGAVTTEDFVHAMEVASGADLTQFKNWYDQSGTPQVQVHAQYDSIAKTLKLDMTQMCPPTPGQPLKKAFHIPITTALLSSGGQNLEFSFAGKKQSELVLPLKEFKQSFTFENVTEKPTPSLLRGFSAPVKLEYNYSDADLSFLLANETDSFNRWEAGQKLFVRSFLQLMQDLQARRSPVVPEGLVTAFAALIKDGKMDPAFKALMLSFPTETLLVQLLEKVDLENLVRARTLMVEKIAQTQMEPLHKLYTESRGLLKNRNNFSHETAGLRHLQNSCLRLMCQITGSPGFQLAARQFSEAQNMTDEIGALSALNSVASSEREQVFAGFYKKWQRETLVMNKWLGLQATCPFGSPIDRIKATAKDSVFDKTNPNKVFELFYRFGMDNLQGFHEASGKSYDFMIDQILEIDGRNPSVAARLISNFNHFKKFDSSRQSLMRSGLSRVVTQPGVSNNIFEIASKALT